MPSRTRSADLRPSLVSLFLFISLCGAVAPVRAQDGPPPLTPVVPRSSASDWRERAFQGRLTGGDLTFDRDMADVVDPQPDRPFATEGPTSDGVWSEIPPPALWQHSTIYDPIRDRLVVFGGVSYKGPSAEVWQLNLSGSPRWQRLITNGTGPTARSMHTAIYDSARDRMIVFGGFDDHFLNDVWALSLSGTPQWTPLVSHGTLPAPRGWHAAIYDAARSRMIVFAGTNGTSRMGDVWTLSLSDDSTWTALSPTGAPPGPRSSPVAIYDSPRDRLVFFGGLDGSGDPKNDVWALALGSPAWSQLSVSGTPPSLRVGSSAIYDPSRQRLVLFAGGTGAPNLNDTWALTLSGSPTWTLLAPANPPQGRQFHTAVYDPIGDRMLVFGGSSGPILSGTWALSLSATQAWIPLSGTRRRGHVALLDDWRRRIVVFGGEDGTALNDVWELDLASLPSWTKLTPSGTPPAPRTFHAGVYDPVRDRMVIFGGRDTAPMNDVWELSFSGTLAWRQLLPMGSPPAARIDHGAVYDPLRHRMIVFGGVDAGGNPFNDVWALSLSGTPTWTQLFPTGTAPAGRGAAAVVYDPTRDRVVIFGGYDRQLLALNDCWELRLSPQPTWSRLTPGGSTPLARLGSAMIYDGQRDRLVLFGGTDLISYYGDTWEMNLFGVPTWNQIVPAGVTPLQRSDHKAIYDADEDRMILFAGIGIGGGHLNDTWELRFLPVVAVDPTRPNRAHVWPVAPNPSRGPTRFEFESPEASEARVAIFDLGGRLVREVTSGPVPAGRHAAAWDGRSSAGAPVAPGIYFYRITVGAAREDGKLVIVN